MKSYSTYYTLVTGGSSGIGKAIAIACARRNMNLLLVSLHRKKLERAAKYIRSRYDVEIETYACDLTQSNSCQQLVRWIDQKNICINMLINNAGVGSTGGFDQYTVLFYQKQILLNVMSLTILTRLLVNNMKKLDEAYIMNVASMFGFFHVPYKDVYAATKSFVITFTRSLRDELKHTGIHVSVLCPGPVRTSKKVCARLDRHGWVARKTAMMPEQVAEDAIMRLLRNEAIVIPGRVNRMYFVLDKLIPSFIKEKILEAEFRTFAAKSG